MARREGNKKTPPGGRWGLGDGLKEVFCSADVGLLLGIVDDSQPE